MEAAKQEMTAKKFQLPTGKVVLQPVVRPNSLIAMSAQGGDLKKHAGYFRWSDTTYGFILPKSTKTGQLVNALTPEEEEGLGSIIKRDLSIYNKKDNFWSKFKVDVRIDDDFKENGKEFDLSDPYDYIAVKVMKTWNTVAPSWEDRFKRGEYIFALVSSDHKDEEIAKETDENLKIYEYFAGIKNKKDAMVNFLAVYWLETGKADRPTADADKDFLRKEIQKVINDDRAKVLELIDDKLMDYKYKFYKAITIGAIIRNYGSNSYELPSGKPIGSDFSKAIAYFRDARNQNDWLKIEAQLGLQDTIPTPDNPAEPVIVESKEETAKEPKGNKKNTNKKN